MCSLIFRKIHFTVCWICLVSMVFPVLCQAQDRVAKEVMQDDSFLPFYFDGCILPGGKLFNATLGDSLFKGYSFVPPVFPFPEIKGKTAFEKQLDRSAYYYFVDHYPDKIQYFYWNKSKKLRPEPLKTNIFQEFFQVDNNPDFELITGPDKYDPGWKFWFANGNHLIQFSQNYISNNWYKGGVGNLNLLSNQNLTVNYKKDKIQFNNFLEWNLSLFTNPVDTMRRTKIGTDLVRIYSDFGIKAFSERWFYSANLEIKTQLFNNYVENKLTVISALGSPLLVNIGILGMKYRLNKEFKHNKYKKLSVDADGSPLSVKIAYVGDKRVDPTRWITDGDKHKTDFGSLINSTLVYNFNKNVWMKSRFKYFTNYKRIEIESENELNMALNRYFSTRIYVYARFDDMAGIPQDPDLGHIQMNEILSFGFNYRW